MTTTNSKAVFVGHGRGKDLIDWANIRSAVSHAVTVVERQK